MRHSDFRDRSISSDDLVTSDFKKLHAPILKNRTFVEPNTHPYEI